MGRFWHLAWVFLMSALLLNQPGPCSAQDAWSGSIGETAGMDDGSFEPDDAFLGGIAEDSWSYLHSDWATSNSLPYSWRSDGSPWGNYSNPAEMGLYALSWIAAHDLQRPWSPSWEETEANVTKVIDQLALWQSDGTNAYSNSVFYEGYWIDHRTVGDGDNDRNVSSADNAWLALSLMTIREYAESKGHPGLANRSDMILKNMDFRLWFNSENGSFCDGAKDDPLAGAKLQPRYSDKDRVVNFAARALGQIDREEFRRSLEAFSPAQDGNYKTITVRDVNSDGSYLAYVAPALFLREESTSFGVKTLNPATRAQIAYAEDQGYPAWGLSGCFDVSDGAYVVQGAPPYGDSGIAEVRPGVVAPYASALALVTPLAPEAIDNLRILKRDFPCSYNSSYGFHDSVNVSSEANESCQGHFSALAQEWTLLSIANYESDFIWRYLYEDPGVVQAHREVCEFMG